MAFTLTLRKAFNIIALLTALHCCVVNISLAQKPPGDTTQRIIAGRSNSAQQQTKPYVILISADGFRYDLADRYHAANLLQLRNDGVAAASMRPSYPSLTFPNH